METNPSKGRPALLMAAVAIAALMAVGYFQSATAQREAAPGGVAHYTVVATEGHNLIVTDNQTNTLSFYTIDKDAEVGSELKLRGVIDLNQVGKPTIKPTDYKAKP
jgi:hypothetical protein